jgi:hypothetical protein
MKKLYTTHVAVLALTQHSFSQNHWPTSGNAGINTQTPSSYSHGGNNTFMEVKNTNTAANSQSHILLPTNATSNLGSIGTLSWAVPKTAHVQKLASYKGSQIVSNSTPSISSKLTFATNNAGSLVENMTISADGKVGIGKPEPVSHLHVNGAITMLEDRQLNNQIKKTKHLETRVSSLENKSKANL